VRSSKSTTYHHEFRQAPHRDSALSVDDRALCGLVTEVPDIGQAYVSPGQNGRSIVE